MRWTPALAFLLVLMLAACGGSGSGGTDSDGGDGEPTDAAETTDDGNGGNGGDDDGDGNGGNGSSGDLDQLAEDLTPPNSSETSRTTAGTVIFLTFTSTDSPDDLKSFYESAIADTGLEVFSTTSTQGTYSWIFGVDEGDGSGGIVTVSPDPNGGGSQVGVQVGTGE